MSLEDPPPTEATVKYLYAHAYRCAYEGCRRPLYQIDGQTCVRRLNSRVYHINARREGVPAGTLYRRPKTTARSRFSSNVCGACQYARRRRLVRHMNSEMAPTSERGGSRDA